MEPEWMEWAIKNMPKEVLEQMIAWKYWGIQWRDTHIVELKTILTEIVSDYEADIKAKYTGTLNFPCRQRDYDADMDVIRRAKKLLEQTE